MVGARYGVYVKARRQFVGVRALSLSYLVNFKDQIRYGGKSPYPLSHLSRLTQRLDQLIGTISQTNLLPPAGSCLNFQSEH